MNQSQTYFQITKTTMSDLFITTLADDPEFADYNRRLFQIWAGKWVGRTTEALRDFMGAFQLLPKGSWDRADVQASVARVVDDWIEDYANRIGYKADRNAMINTVMSGLK
jgi:methane monooxygenase component A beta chain